jgi:hypothetical protein
MRDPSVAIYFAVILSICADYKSIFDEEFGAVFEKAHYLCDIVCLLLF